MFMGLLYTETYGLPETVAGSENACLREGAGAVSPERPLRASPRHRKDDLEGAWQKVTLDTTCHLWESKLPTSFGDLGGYLNPFKLQFLYL